MLDLADDLRAGRGAVEGFVPAGDETGSATRARLADLDHGSMLIGAFLGAETGIEVRSVRAKHRAAMLASALSRFLFPMNGNTL